MQPYTDQADRLATASLMHRRIAQFTGIDDGYSAAAHDFDVVIWRDEGRRILVKAYPDGERVVRQRRQ